MQISNKNKISTFLGWVTVEIENIQPQVNVPGSYVKKELFCREVTMSQAPRLKNTEAATRGVL